MDDLMTIGEVAEYLKVCRATATRWSRTGELPAVKVGKSYRIRRRDLEAWYDGKRAA